MKLYQTAKTLCNERAELGVVLRAYKNMYYLISFSALLLCRGEKMNYEYSNYAKLLEPIRDLIVDVSYGIEPTNKEPINDKLQRYETALVSIEAINPPIVIKNEHKLLITVLRKWLSVIKQGDISADGNVVNFMVLKLMHVQKELKQVLIEIAQKFNN
ncbi:hypothetical protein [Lysinibacillus sp. fls2-241-R2A-57]|uniref:hypothetical protein n=1 Tax=Lysinibacillus sp. fls2-241-R2A-57 TaxID=3040292 RepID=UPI002555A640|nr:hypothetical protein [Lysinibacillus sp. fls2-241-R2A-57]